MYFSGKYIRDREPAGMKIGVIKDYPIIRVVSIDLPAGKPGEGFYLEFYFNKWLTLYSYNFEWWTLSNHTQDELPIIEKRLQALENLGADRYEVIRVVWDYQADDQEDRQPIMVWLSIGEKPLSMWMKVIARKTWVCPVTAGL